MGREGAVVDAADAAEARSATAESIGTALSLAVGGAVAIVCAVSATVDVVSTCMGEGFSRVRSLHPPTKQIVANPKPVTRAAMCIDLGSIRFSSGA